MNFAVPVFPLVNIILMPGTTMLVDVVDPNTIDAVNYALKNKCEVVIVGMKPPAAPVHLMDISKQVGTLCEINRVIKLGEGKLRITVTGLDRCRIVEFKQTSPFCLATFEVIGPWKTGVSEHEETAMRLLLQELVAKYVENNSKAEALNLIVNSTDDLLTMVNEVIKQFPTSFENRMELFNTITFSDRFDCLVRILSEDTEIQQLKTELSQKIRQKIDQNQKEYIMRQQMNAIRAELGDDDESDTDAFLAQCEKLEADDSVKEKIRKEIKRLSNISGNSSEAAVARGYIETLLAMPWDRKDPDAIDLKKAQKILDEDHYGLEKVKERIVEFLAVRSLTSKGQIPILCLVGPPGTGKTSIAKSIARALDKKYIRVALGGVRDEAEIRGHRRTYVGAMPGRIATGLKNAGVKNPLVLLDEIDKVSADYKGDPASALLEVLDSEQNSRFVDHYVEIPIDLSDVLFIATANNVQTIPGPLLDRMELIEINSYTPVEKLHIAKEHLIPKQIKRNGLCAKQLTFTSKAISAMILGYTREAGVRSLERRIGEVCRKVARELLENETGIAGAAEEQVKALLASKPRINITPSNLEHYLGKVRYVTDKEKHKSEVGIVTGLAWTSVGGDTLQVEVNTMPGEGRFDLTGQLGDVMKESARAGISYIRSVAAHYSIEPDYFKNTDFHIHIPEGAVPKDGPSAGITMATAVLSAITGRKVRGDIAMTGEITLRGRVLPIGGLKEKIIAAKNAGIKTVILPEKNRRDIEEISDEILEGVKLCYASTMDDVLKYALV